MQILEKIIFLEMTNQQLGKMPDKQYYDAFNELKEAQKEEFYLLSREIHAIWNYINSPYIPGITKPSITTIEEYHQQIAPVSEIILQLFKEYNITLKHEMSPEFKAAIKKHYGDNFEGLYYN